MKRFAKLLISIGFFGICWVNDLLSRTIGRISPGHCVILYYHAVPKRHKDRFAKQMDMLVRLAEPVPADWKSPLLSGVFYAGVTFDDAYRNLLPNALPTMRAMKIPATIFVATVAIGKSPDWHDSSAESKEDHEVMCESELQGIPTDLVTIGSHSLTHPVMSELGAAEAKHELVESRRILEQMLQRPVRLFSFPFGAIKEELIGWSREAGYERVFTTLPYLALSEPGEFVTGRVRVDPTDWKLEFQLKLLGAYRWLPYAFAVKRKILQRRAKAKASEHPFVNKSS